MIAANSLHDFVSFIGNQYQTGRISPNEFNLAWKRAETEYLNSLLGKGRLREDSMGGTDAAKDILRILTTSTTITNDKWGEMDLPEDYFRFNAMDVVKGVKAGQRVSLLSPDQWASRSESKLNPVEKYPIAKLQGDKVIALPVSTRYNLTYLRTPATPQWGYTLDPFTRPVYDPATSVDSELPEYLTNEIAFRICSYLGINISKVELIQYSEAKTT